MRIIIVALILIVAVPVVARDYSENDFRRQSHMVISGADQITDSGSVFTFCEDGVVCYDIDGGYNGSGSCFRDKDLVEKYCR